MAMDGIASALIEITIYSAVIFFLLTALKQFLGSRLSPAAHYALWALLILRLCIPFTADTNFRLITLPAKTSSPASFSQEIYKKEDASFGQTDTSRRSDSDVNNEFDKRPAQSEKEYSPISADKNISAEAPNVLKAVVIVWATGAGIMLVQLFISFILLHIKLQKGARPVPECLKALFGAERLRLGIRGSVRLSCIAGLSTPALSPWGIVLMPSSFVQEDVYSSAQISLMLRHELTHYKRRDNVIVLLLALLRCVYWFNPIVWIAMRSIRTDMEIACDSSAVRSSSADERSLYAHTVLSCFSAPKARLILGISYGNTKKTAEKRIRGIYSSCRSTRTATTIAFITSIVMLAVCFTTACQPTPEKAPVVNKNDGKLEEAINNPSPETSSNAASELSFPERWNETLKTGSDKLTISVDADIEGTGLDAYPVVEVFAAEYSDKQINEFIRYFAGGKKLFDASGETKADVERLLIDAKRGTEVDGVIVPPEPDDPYIKSLEEKLANMSDDSRQYITNPVLCPTPAGSMALYAGVELENNEDASLCIVNLGEHTYSSQMSYSRGGYLIGSYLASLNSIKLEAPSVSEDEALAAAQKVVEDLGITDMRVSEISPRMIGKSANVGGLFTDYTSSGYSVVFMRDVYGMLMTDISQDGNYTYSSGGEAPEYQPSYTAPWLPERLEIYVDENGVQKFNYQSRIVERSVLNGSVQLLSFEEIKERAAKQLFYKTGSMLDYCDIMQINIDRVVLGGALINKKNEPGVGMLVPAWHLFYTKDGTINGAPLSDDNVEVMVLNAIDGSVIETFPSYA